MVFLALGSIRIDCFYGSELLCSPQDTQLLLIFRFWILILLYEPFMLRLYLLCFLGFLGCYGLEFVYVFQGSWTIKGN